MCSRSLNLLNNEHDTILIIYYYNIINLRNCTTIKRHCIKNFSSFYITSLRGKFLHVHEILKYLNLVFFFSVIEKRILCIWLNFECILFWSYLPVNSKFFMLFRNIIYFYFFHFINKNNHNEIIIVCIKQILFLW